MFETTNSKKNTATEVVPYILNEVLEGLSKTQKELPCKLLYDQKGSELFDMICELPEYYPTRTETSILEDNIDSIMQKIGENAWLIEYGSGSSKKIRFLLDRLKKSAGYVPIDISEEHLLLSAEELRSLYSGLNILPVCADYTRPFELPETITSNPNRTIFFPGSTIGNFHPSEAVPFLKQMSHLAGPEGKVILGVDLKKDQSTLIRAYNDIQGVTSEFNLNLLNHLNRELDCDFDLNGFYHQARWNKQQGRMEMHLISKTSQMVRIAGSTISFKPDETIWTESSYKYSLEEFGKLAKKAGLDILSTWTDPQQLFSVHCLKQS